MAHGLPTPPPYEAGQDFSRWLRGCEFYMIASDITSSPRKAATILTLLGQEVQELARTLPDVPEEAPAGGSGDSGSGDRDEYSRLTAKLKAHFGAKVNPTFERAQLHALGRKAGESFGVFVSRLRIQADRCQYTAEQLESVVLECAVAHCADRELQKKFFGKPALTLSEALRMAQLEEQIRAQVDSLNAPAPSAVSAESDVSLLSERAGSGCRACGQRTPAAQPRGASQAPRAPSVGRARGSSQMPRASTAPACFRCRSRRHASDNCPFRQAECYACHRVGHTRSACPRGQPGSDRANQVAEGSDMTRQDSADRAVEEHAYGIYTVTDRSIPVVVEVTLNGAPISMQVDTGASRSVISRVMFTNLWANPPRLEPLGRPLLTYTGQEVPVVGVATLEVAYQGQLAMLPLVVADVEGPPLLGREWLQVIRLDWRSLFGPDPLHSLSAPARSDDAGLEAALEKTRAEFSDLFQSDLGRYNVRKVSIELDPAVKPIFLKHRPPPFAQREAIEKELDRQVAEGILEPVKTSRWAAPVVPVKKANGTLRLCGSYDQTVNKASKLETYPLPRVDELFAAMAGGQMFTKIDLRDAYFQLELDDLSKEALTINTHKGLFRPNRLGFGVKSAVSIFQREMETLLSGIPNVAVFLDDIAVTGPDPAAHQANVREVLRRLSSAGLRVNGDKSVWLAEEVTYLGFCISAAGVRATSEKTKAVQDAPEPRNLPELKAYLGLLQYYARFLPDLATVAAPLYSLERKGATWNWGDRQRTAFLQTKQLLVAAPVLTHYDPGKPLVLTTDASSYGLGAVLSHPDAEKGDRPIAYASRTLSDAERNYSQLDKEALGVIFGVGKFHQYLYGRPFLIRTDHKPLLGLLSSDKALPLAVSPRILRWRLMLAGYQYQFQYVAGKSISNADGLSRLPLSVIPASVPIPGDVANMLDDVSHAVDVDHIRVSTGRDPVLSRVLRCLQSGWPQTAPSDVNLLPYYRRRHELSLQDGCILWGCRVVVPPPLRTQLIMILHDGHPGMNQMKRLARCHVWWPQMDAMIEDCVRSCHRCQIHRGKQPEVPAQPWAFPQRPWQRVHVDFAGPVEGKQLLVVVDAYSKWCDVHICASASSAAAIEKLRMSFSSHGLPVILVSDNGTAFTSAEFQAFTRGNRILHKFSPPLHPASNGQAEALVKVVKSGIAQRSGGSLQTRLSRFRFKYLNTPHSTTGRTPAELMLGRPMRGTMDLVRPDLTAKVERHQQAWKDRSDRGACDRQFRVGEEVYATAIPQVEQRWVPAVVTSVEGQSCEIRLADGRVFRRHRSHLRTRHAPDPGEDQPPGWRQPTPPARAPRLPQAPGCPAAVAPPLPLPEAPPLPLPEEPPSPMPETDPPPPAAQSPVRESVASLPPMSAPAPRRSAAPSAPQHPLPLSPVVGSAAGQRTLRPQRSRRAPIRLDL